MFVGMYLFLIMEIIQQTRKRDAFFGQTLREFSSPKL